MAKQLSDLNEILGNFVTNEDFLLLRDTSAKEDVKISIQSLGNALFLAQHNVGSVYITYSEDDDPNLRGGEWELSSKGRSIIGVDPSDTDFSSAELQGGAKTHQLTNNELPILEGTLPHGACDEASVSGIVSHISGGSSYRELTPSGTNVTTKHRIRIGNNQPHNNMHPWETAFVWRRTA